MRAGAVDHEAPLAGAVGDGHAERVEEREVCVRLAADGREVVADDQRVGAREQAHALQLAEHAFAAAGEPEPRRRQHEAKQRDRLERFARCEQRLAAERRTGARVEEVDRHLARLERRELEREVDTLRERLTHPEDPAAAELHAGVDREPRGRDAVVVGVGAADAREDLPAGFEIVVVAPHAGRREPLGLLDAEEPE